MCLTLRLQSWEIYKGPLFAGEAGRGRTEQRGREILKVAMLNTGNEARLFGLRYSGVFPALALAGILLSVALLGVYWMFPEQQGLQVLLTAVLAGLFALSLFAGYRLHLSTARLADVQTTSKAILESLVGGVITFDVAGNITIINRAAARMLELPAQAPYPSLDEFSVRNPMITQAIRRALREEEYVQDLDSTFVTSAGSTLLLRTTISAQVDGNGLVVGLVVLVKDVSRLVALEQELRKRDRLAAAGSLAAGVAHEVRNPLSAIELNLRLLREEVAQAGALTGDVSDYFDILSVETQRLNRITTSFLQLSRPDRIRKDHMAVLGPLQQALRLLEPEAKTKHIRFQVNLEHGQAEIAGDATKLEQVYLNLLINAMQAMPNGGTVRIESRFHQGDDDASIEVVIADEGEGVAAENMDRLFDPYFTTRNDGTGLGLAIADRIISDHGGAIAVESSSGQGTRFAVRLPVLSSSYRDHSDEA